ncbi:P-loop NTPase fold protein [Micromonospora sp. NPDC002296]|uniref:KAP family P-loop NTPase fold protein n=1 Tax=Micromonospora sp. NPDC002296 TaxID=3154271 RepID=UPI00332D9EF6
MDGPAWLPPADADVAGPWVRHSVSRLDRSAVTRFGRVCLKVTVLTNYVHPSGSRVFSTAPSTIGRAMTGLAVLSDAPVRCDEDQLRFDRYVEPILSLLTSPTSTTPFTVGVLGAWGSGKSSVLAMVDERLGVENPDAFVRVHFNPWVHRNEPNMLVPLLHALQETLLADRKKRFTHAVTRVASVIGTLTADALLTTLTAGFLTVDKYDQAVERYVAQRSQVESELRNLRNLLRDEVAGIRGQGAQVVFFIDDIDRCEPDQIVDLLESVKLFLDVPGVFVLMAISKELVDRGVAIKYQGFGFDPDGMMDIGDEYLEKMIQLPLYLLPLDSRSVRRLVEAHAQPALLARHGDLLQVVLRPNPRKIKRVLNFLTVTTAIVAGTPGLDELRDDLVVRLAVLRVQVPRLFSAVLTDPRVLVVLECLYRDRLEFTEDGFRSRYGDDSGTSLYHAVAPHYRRQPELEHLFAASTFEEEQDRIHDYLTLFGGRAA